MYIYICIYIYIHTSIYIYLSIYLSIYLYLSIYIYLSIYLSISIGVQVSGFRSDTIGRLVTSESRMPRVHPIYYTCNEIGPTLSAHRKTAQSGVRLPRFQLSTFGCRVPGFIFWVPGCGFRDPVSVFRFSCSSFRVPVFVFRFSGSGFRVPVLGFRSSGSSFRDADCRFREPGPRRVSRGRRLRQASDSPARLGAAAVLGGGVDYPVSG